MDALLLAIILIYVVSAVNNNLFGEKKINGLVLINISWATLNIYQNIPIQGPLKKWSEHSNLTMTT
jgi:hypothetical protein